MNDRFKFRLWHEKQSEMIELGICPQCSKCSPHNPVNLEECNMMQCTGLKDKNDTLIFEGDIVRCVQERLEGFPTKELRVVGVVSWSEPLLVYEVVEANEATSLAFFDNDEIEVIGNIYENPELLKGEKNVHKR